ncbi:MAG: ABC transporter ATP-binding protein [Anaerolineales bacterium]
MHLQTQHLSIGYALARKLPHVIAAGLNLSLAGGQLVCLLGPNGAGKSTLMRTLAGMQPVLSGRVLLGDQDIHRQTPRQRARLLSVVLTERPNLGLLNGYALVALGRHPYTGWTGRLSRYDEAIIHWAVDAVDAGALADKPVMELSDGQRQKLMLARALAQESELILLDEPTAFLDLPRRAEMMRLLRHIVADTGRAILLSTHDLDLALRSADGLWLMAGGEVQVGSPEDLIINGAFEAAFKGEGVLFDRETGAFSVERSASRAVEVLGEGIPHTWTRRALRRAGFALQPAAGSPNGVPRISLSGDEHQPIWHLTQYGHHATYSSIEALLEAMRQDLKHMP